MLFFVAPFLDKPTGGLKQTYRHVQLLHEAGVDARVLHPRPGVRCEWFDHRAPLAAVPFPPLTSVARWRPTPYEPLHFAPGDQVLLESTGQKAVSYELRDTDVFVVPEYRGMHIAGALPGFRLVIFNQNAHNTFRYYPIERRRSETIYEQKNVLGVVTVSEHNQRYVRFGFPHLRVLRVVNGVDSALFHPGPRKEHRIAFMPRKLKEDLAEVINILSGREVLGRWQLTPIDRMDERQVAAELRRSFVFLSTSHREGFGLPPIEAGMSGCLVVGYTGAAAREYMDPELCFPVHQQDTLGFAQTLEDVLLLCEREPTVAFEKGQAFSERLSAEYSLEIERRSVLEAWRELLPEAFSPAST